MNILIRMAAVILLCMTSVEALAVEDISQEDLLTRMKDKTEQLILDVRSEGEFSRGHIEGAVNIPHNQVADRLDELKKYKEKDIIIHCQSGGRVRVAVSVLAEAGFKKLFHLDGDMGGWRANGHPIVK